jgi:hypothetical protein
MLAARACVCVRACVRSHHWQVLGQIKTHELVEKRRGKGRKGNKLAMQLNAVLAAAVASSSDHHFLTRPFVVVLCVS